MSQINTDNRIGRPRVASPLRAIVERLPERTERLECGHIISHPIALGMGAEYVPPAKRRRCYFCAEGK